MSEQTPLVVAATVIVISKDRKALILKRLATEKVFPNLWTVAGGKLKTNDGDYANHGFYYYPVESAVCRELQEETGMLGYYARLRLKYLCSIVSTDVKRLILSYYVVFDEHNADEFHIKTENGQEYAWITEDEIPNYDFIFDIGGEIRQVFDIIDNRVD